MGDIISSYLNSLPSEERKEAVNGPEYYGGKGNVYEAINVIEAYGMGFCDGNVLKYLLRYKKKNGIEDLHKAQWYLDRLIENEERKQNRKGSQTA
jgi:hypothetical protein